MNLSRPSLSRLALVAVAACVLFSTFAVSALAGYVSVGVFANAGSGNGGSGSGQGELSDPGRAAVHQATGHLYVADTGNDRVQVFSTDATSGSFLTEFGTGDLDAPYGLAIDQGTGDVYVSDATGVIKYEPDGQPTPAFTADGTFSAPGTPSAPLAFDQAADELVIADPADDQVERYDTTGAAVGTPFDGSSSPGGAFAGLLDVAVDSTGDVLVVDSSGDILTDTSGTSSRVERFDSTGAHEATIGPVDGAGSVAVDPDGDQVLVAGRFHAWNSSTTPQINVFAPDGTPTNSFDMGGTYAITPGLAPVGGDSTRIYAVTKDPYDDIWGPTAIHILDDVDPPEATATPATDVAATTATLNGTVDPNGADTTYRFEYTFDGSSDWTATSDQQATGDDPVDANAQIQGLQPNSGYVYRIVATNPGGQATSNEQPFTTGPAAPTVQPQVATAITPTTALLRARVNPHGQTTTYRFEYGTDTSYGQTTADADAGDGHDADTVTTKITGLQPATTYHYRLVAENATGQTQGEDRTFQTAPTPVADTCPNATIRKAQNSTHLANCRAYEQVSPPDKNGYPVYYYAGVTDIYMSATASSRDGNAALFGSWGLFAGASGGMPTTYRSQRFPDGWRTVPASPPPTTPTPNAFGPLVATWMQASADLEEGLVSTLDFFDPLDQNGIGDVYLDRMGSPPELMSRGNSDDALQSGADIGNNTPVISADGTAVAFHADSHLVPEDADRVAQSSGAKIDLYVRQNGVTHLVNIGLDDGFTSRCGSVLGDGGTTRYRDALSEDGSHAVFTAPHPAGFGDPSCSDPQQVYVRIDGERTLQASASQRSTPDPAGTGRAYYGEASADGSAVYFGSGEMLTDDAPPGGGLYRFSTVTEKLAFIGEVGSVDAPTVRASHDGSRVYFVGAGFRDLYVWADGETRLVASSETGNLGSELRASFRPAYSTPDGGHLVFSTTDQLTDAEHVDPVTGDPLQAVYLYTYDEDSLVCVSCDPAGQAPAETDPASAFFPGDRPTQGGGRFADDTGEHVVFMTRGQLVPRDTNQVLDVYEYSGGRLSLVSSGKSDQASRLVNISPDGESVFFVADDALVGADRDAGNSDLYVARSNGGFPDPVTPPAGCEGDGCQGGGAGERERAKPGSDLLTGRGDISSPGAARALRLAPLGTAARRALLRDGRLPVTIRVRGGGRLSLRLTVTVGGKRRTLATAQATVRRSAPRTVRLTLRVRGRASRQLLRRARAARVQANLRGAPRPASRKLNLTSGSGR